MKPSKRLEELYRIAEAKKPAKSDADILFISVACIGEYLDEEYEKNNKLNG